MKYIWVLVYLSLFFGSLILSSSSILNQVNALSCEGPITVERSFEDSKVVFLGEVISKKYYLQDEEYGYEDSIVKFKLKESFKGFSNETITLETSEWFWDPTYEEGNDYVVFAIINPQQNVLRPQLCTISSIPEEKNLQQLRLLANPEQTPKETLTLPPKKQIEKGIELEDVTCKEDLQLIFKYDGSPACVKPETAEKLIERGWAVLSIDQLEKVWVELYPIGCAETICYIDWLKSYYVDVDLQPDPSGLGNLRGIGFAQTTEFINDYFDKRGIIIFDVRYDLVGRSVCEYGECWDIYNLSLLVSESDVDSMVKIGYKVAN